VTQSGLARVALQERVKQAAEGTVVHGKKKRRGRKRVLLVKGVKNASTCNRSNKRSGTRRTDTERVEQGEGRVWMGFVWTLAILFGWVRGAIERNRRDCVDLSRWVERVETD
jgi:hypothetical protein